MPNELDFLDTLHPVYVRCRDEWRRNERRGFGAYAADLMQFTGEDPLLYALRQDRCTYVNFMKGHALGVTGHLRQFSAPAAGSPNFSMGSLGPVRPATEVRPGDESNAERIYYNADGIGRDGLEWPAFFDSVDLRAQYTGHRVLMVETPPLDTPEPSQADVNLGLRTFLAEYSALEMTMWAVQYGVRQFAILRVPVETGQVVDGSWKEADQTPRDGDPFPGRGYYLLVRANCTLLGPKFNTPTGGYWLFRSDKSLVRTRPWGPRLRGQIPLWLHYGEKSSGTVHDPRVSQSPTDPLGRIGVSLMDMLSARDWDAFDAARSGKWFLNADKSVMTDIKQQWDARSINIGVPPAFPEDAATLAALPVDIYDDSSGAVAPAVFQAIIDGKFIEAKEQSFQVVTSAPDSSGLAREMGFAENKVPYLVYRAGLGQGSEQTGIFFTEARMGKVPTGFSRWGRNFTLQPLVDDIDRAFGTLRLNQMRSPTMEPEMALRAIRDRLGGLPLPGGATEETVRAELRTSVEDAKTADAQAGQLGSSFGA